MAISDVTGVADETPHAVAQNETASVGHLTGTPTSHDFGYGLVAAIRLPNGAVIALTASIHVTVSCAKIGSYAEIGSYAKIGSGAEIGSGAKIGSGASAHGFHRYWWTAYKRTDDKAPGLYLSIGCQLHTAEEWEANAEQYATEAGERISFGPAIRALVAFVRVLLS